MPQHTVWKTWWLCSTQKLLDVRHVGARKTSPQSIASNTNTTTAATNSSGSFFGCHDHSLHAFSDSCDGCDTKSDIEPVSFFSSFPTLLSPPMQRM